MSQSSECYLNRYGAVVDQTPDCIPIPFNVTDANANLEDLDISTLFQDPNLTLNLTET